jgi:hypothetical protein
VYLLPLNIKLELTEKFAKAQNKVSYMYLRNKLPRKSDANIKEGVFVGPQIKE